jgi:hypothetical protein
MEVEEIKKELQESNNHLNERQDKQLEQLCTIQNGEQKQNSAPTTEEEMENRRQRNMRMEETGWRCVLWRVKAWEGL